MTPASRTATATRAGSGARDPWAVPDPARPVAKASLLDAVTDLRRDVEATRFPLPLEGVDVAEGRRRQLLDQLDDHLLPRLRELSAPAVVVVAGSTGAGKSTLVNSILGTEVSAAGVLRPTTRRPVLVHHADDLDLLSGHPLMAIVDVVAHDAVPRGIALVDAPDLDSLLATNRSTAHRLLEAADLWIFVTTAARYGDALPWEVLDRATARGTSMAMVLNRVPEDALVTVRGDLMTRLRERGMSAVPLFLVPDVGPHQGMLDARAVAPILRWLTMVAGPDRARSVIARTQRGSLAALRPWVEDLAEAVQAQVDARAALEQVVEAAVEGPASRAARAVVAGTLANGPVRGRWIALSGPRGPLSGRWTSRRGAAARAQALAQVGAELMSSATIALAAARHAGTTAVAEALAATSAPGARGVLDAVEARPALPETFTTAPDPEQSAGDWMRSLDQQVSRLATSTDRSRSRAGARLVRSVGPGAGALLGASALGLGAARAALTTLLGPEATPAVDEAVADLVGRATEQALAGAAPARAALASSDLADDAASRLRLRRAVLKGLS